MEAKTTAQTQTTPGFTSNTSYIPYKVAQLETKARIRQVAGKENTNPLMAADPLDRQAGVYARGLRMINTPLFKGMNDVRKKGVLGHYYDQYVMPAYASSQLKPPDKDTWIKEFMRPDGPSMRVSDFYLNHGAAHDAGSDFAVTMLNVGAAATRVLANIMNGPFVAGFKRAEDQKLFGLKGYFPAPEGDNWRRKVLDEDTRMYNDKNVKGFMRMNQNAIDDANFWFEMRPTATLAEKSGSYVGEQVITLPLYEAIGLPLKSLGEVLTADKFLRANTGGLAANLTRRCSAHWFGRAVGNRIINASEAYVGGMAMGESPAERDKNIIRFMVGGAVLGTGATVVRGVGKGIDKLATEKLLSENLALGGIPFVEAVTTKAAHGLNTNTFGHDNIGQPIPTGGTVESAEAAFNHANSIDPVAAKAERAAAAMLQQVAKDLYGPNTVFQKMGPEAQQKVIDEIKVRTAKAAPTIPVNVPDLQKKTISDTIQQQAAESPDFAEALAQVRKMGAPFGITPENVAITNEQNAINDQTGHNSVQGASSKSQRAEEAKVGRQKDSLLKRVIKSAEKKGQQAEWTGPAQAPVRAKVKAKRAFAPKQEADEGVRNYVSFKVDSLQRFTNGINSAAQKSNQTLSKFLSGMEDKDFVDEMDRHLGGSIYFEKPEDMMIWAIHHDDKLPKALTNKAVRFMQDRDPELTRGELKQQGRLLDFHIEMLAYTGKLDTERNVFRSTITSGWSSRTKWQKQLMQDLSREEMNDFNMVMGPFKKHFPKEYAEGARQLTQMQALRQHMKTLEAAVMQTRSIRKQIYKQGAHTQGGEALQRLLRHGYGANL